MNKYLKSIGYEANLCFMGEPKKVYRLTFCGEYIGTAKTLQDANLKAIFHNDERTIKIF